MKQTIEIEVPDGKKAVWKGNKVVFEDIKPSLPKTWKEFCNNNEIEPNEYFIGNDSNMCRWLGIKYRQPDCKNMLPSKRAAEQHLALMQLHQLRDCYRQADSSKDLNEIWYSITKHEGKPFIYRNTFRDSFLEFSSKEIAEEFLDNFRDLIEQAGDLI